MQQDRFHFLLYKSAENFEREKTLGHVTFKTFFHGNIEGRNQKLLLPIPGKSLYVHFTVIIFTPSKDGLLKSNHHATQLPLKLANNIYDISISYSYICKSNNNVCIKTIRIYRIHLNHIYLPFT